MPDPKDRHYPLGFVQGATEITEDFGAEAEAIGVITILWNRHELRLKSVFVALLAPLSAFAIAAWEGENTHRGRLKLLRLAQETLPMSETARQLLTGINDQTVALSEKRNALAHAEYVVDVEQDVLLARTTRRLKPPIYHPSDLGALHGIIGDLREADAWVGALTVELLPEGLRAEVAAFADAVKASRANPA